jgi:hypothetical protein
LSEIDWTFGSVRAPANFPTWGASTSRKSTTRHRTSDAVNCKFGLVWFTGAKF